MGTPVDFWTLDDCVKALSELDAGASSSAIEQRPPHRRASTMSGRPKDVVPPSEDAIRQILAEKERDLEMAAQIGKRLLEQNKDLETRLESLDEQLLSANDRAQQLKHELAQKEQLVQVYSRICEESQAAEELWSPQSGASPHSGSPHVSPAHLGGPSPSTSGRQSTHLSSGMEQLQKKIAQLEMENNQLRVEHSSLMSSRTDERKDRSLVEDCLKQLAEANSHIRNLSDELSQKTDKFLERQNEVSDLFQRSLEMEMRVKQLTTDNVSLNNRLSEAQQSQHQLTDHLVNIRDQYDECLKSLDEAHHEIRIVQTRTASPQPRPRYSVPGGLRPPLSLAAELQASLEAEVEEDVELEPQVTVVRRCSYPWDAKGERRACPRGASEPLSGSPSEESEDASDDSSDGSGDGVGRRTHGGRRRRSSKVRAKRLVQPQQQLVGTSATPRWRQGTATDKVQMVKSMEGSQTLRMWQRLARPSMSSALFERRPGVRVRGCSGSRSSGLGGLGGLLSSSSSSSSEGEGEVNSGGGGVCFGLGSAGMPPDGQEEKTEKEKKEEEEAEDVEVASLTFRLSSAPPDPERTLEALGQRRAVVDQRKTDEAKGSSTAPPPPRHSPKTECPPLPVDPEPSLSASAPSLAAILSERGIRSKTYEELLGAGFPVPPAPPQPTACPATPRNSPTAELETVTGPVNPVLVFTGLLESLSELFRPFGSSPVAPTVPASGAGLTPDAGLLLRRNWSAGSGLAGLNAVTVPPRPPLPAVLHRTDSSTASPKKK